RCRKFARRHKAAFTTAALVAAVLVLGTIVSTWSAIRAGRAEGLAGQRLEAEQKEYARAVEAVREALQRQFEARLAQARASRWSGRTGQRLESWKAIADAARLARDLQLDELLLQKLREEAIACLTLPDMRRMKEWEGYPPGTDG